MKVLALVPYPVDTAPGQRYRIEQWAPYLREQGIEVTFAPFATRELAGLLYQPGHYVAKAGGMLLALARRLPEVLAADRFDVVWILREACLIGPAWAERIARLRGPAVVYDFDDAVYLPYVSPTNRYLSYLKFPSKSRALCAMASSVIAGNQTLADWARRFNRHVNVVPSTVSLRTYRVRPNTGRPGPPVVGWTGSHSSVQYLSVLGRALEELRRRRPFRFVVIGAEGVKISGVETECRPWRSVTEVEDLWEFDVGIMPLPDESWAQGKCGMKAIQYMGVGIPAVVSPVGANRAIVEDGVNGLAATSEGEWVAALERLLTDEDLRRRMGAAARRTVEERFSAEIHAPRVAEILKSLAS